MIYLNGDFDGGSTNFVDETQTLHKVKKKLVHSLCTIKGTKLRLPCLILVEN